MILFTNNDLFTMNVYDRDGRKKKPKKRKTETKEKIFPVWLPSHPPVDEMEADCFLVSENTENKPNLPWWGS